MKAPCAARTDVKRTGFTAIPPRPHYWLADARAQACLASDRARALELAQEVEARLSRLDDLEDLAPPFALTRSRKLRERYLTEWLRPEQAQKAA